MQLGNDPGVCVLYVHDIMWVQSNWFDGLMQPGWLHPDRGSEKGCHMDTISSWIVLIRVFTHSEISETYFVQRRSFLSLPSLEILFQFGKYCIPMDNKSATSISKNNHTLMCWAAHVLRSLCIKYVNDLFYPPCRKNDLFVLKVKNIQLFQKT